MTGSPAAIVVQVSPGAHQSKVTRFAAGCWYLRIGAPAVKGRANEELVRFLSDVLKVSKDSIVISQRVSARRKLIRVLGLTTGEITERLEKQMRDR